MPDPFRPGAFRVVTGDTAQSWVDLSDPTHVDFEYVQRITEALRLTVLTRPGDQRLRIVHLGGGGLSIPRWVAAVRPHTAQIVCEPDSALLEEVRRTLPLPRNSGIKVREVDGRTGLEAMPDAYADAIVLDAFDGHHVPGDLATAEFFATARRVLRPGGVLIVNLTDAGPFRWTRRCLAGLRRSFRRVVLSGEPAVVKGRRFGNLVIVAGLDELPVAALVRSAAGAAFPYRTLYDRDLDRWLGHGAPFLDEAPERSPGPPTGRTWFS